MYFPFWEKKSNNPGYILIITQSQGDNGNTQFWNNPVENVLLNLLLKSLNE